MNHADYCSQFLSPDEKILDVGSGRGGFLCAMAKRGFAVSGVEYNPNNVSLTLEKSSREGLNVKVTQGRAEQLPFPDTTFAFVNCAEVTEHIDDPERACHEIYRVLKPSGSGYISFTNRYGIYDCHYHMLFINWLPRAWAESYLRWRKKNKNDITSGRQTLQAMHYVTFLQAINLLRRCGFVVRDTRVEKIKKLPGLLAPFGTALYLVLLRPFYYNTFHFLIYKPS